MTMIFQRYFTPIKYSAPCRPAIPSIHKKWTASTGFGGRLTNESLCALPQILHLERQLDLELAQCTWMQNHPNLLVIGPTGSGKTYVACALAMSACRNRFLVRYFRTSRLLHRLTLARQDNSYHTLLCSLAKIDLIILDDWMRNVIAVSNAQDLLELLDNRFGYSSTVVASQVHIQDWHSHIPDPTLTDAVPASIPCRTLPAV